MLAHAGDEGEAVHPGQHAIDHRDVVRPRQGERQAGFAVGGIVDDMPGLFEAVDQVALGFQVIFHDKNAHQFPLS